MKQNLNKQSPILKGKELKHSPLINCFLKDADKEEGSKNLKEYKYEVYVHILRVFEDGLILNGIQFSSDGHTCFVKDYSYPNGETDDMVKITREEYNKKVSLCGEMASHILAK
jgi:hypothetical protein